MSGKSSSCKSLARSFGIAIRQNSERINCKGYKMVGTKTEFVFADIYTKAMVEVPKFEPSKID